jgi:hypothetical protein
MPADTISRANLDGTGIQNIALNQIDPTGVAVDGQHVYWGNLEGGTIGRENLAGPFIPSSSSSRAQAVRRGWRSTRCRWHRRR